MVRQGGAAAVLEEAVTNRDCFIFNIKDHSMMEMVFFRSNIFFDSINIPKYNNIVLVF
jgi:hypothetical protein